MARRRYIEHGLTLIGGAAPRNPRLRRLLEVAPLAVMFLLLNSQPARSAGCSFNPAPDPTVDGSSASLRHAIQMANASGQDCLITLEAGTYTLTIKNTHGHENAAAQGDLDITDSGHTVTIQGQGPGRTIVNGNRIDRVFHVVGGANGVFHDLTIEGGLAQDDAKPGALPGTTTAEGGGIMVEGSGQVTLTRVFVKGNRALGGTGANGVRTGSGTAGHGAAGGGLFVSSRTINLASCNISGNAADAGNGGNGGSSSFGGIPGGSGGQGGVAAGGGLYVSSGTINLGPSIISGNTTNGGSGGAGGFPAAVGGNAQVGEGGGLYLAAGTLNLSGSTVSGNAANGGLGGAGGPGFGLYKLPGGSGGNGQMGAGGGLNVRSGHLNLRGSTVSGNTVAGGKGGNGGINNNPSLAGIGGAGGSSLGAGMFVGGGSLSLANSTFYGNAAARGGDVGKFGTGNASLGPGGASAGGGLFVGGGSVNLSGLTVALNRAGAAGRGSKPGSSWGGGIRNSGASSLVSDSTLIGDNTRDAGSAGDGPDVSGAITSSFSLISNTAGASITDNGHNILGKPPSLELPASNGGPTTTVALQSNSPAIDTGDNAICLTPPPTGLGGVDQRGLARSRPGDTRCDIGAFEFINVLVGPSPLNFGSETVHKQTGAQMVYVTNNEAAAVTLTESIGGADPADFVKTASTCGTTLGSHKFCSISIAFKPNATGTRSGLLTVSDKPDRTSPYHVTLAGKGD